MHYPDGDNIITDSDGASWFTDGPPATTLKADVMNALVGELANILKAYNIPLKNSGNDTFDQIAGALIARDQGKTREASVVIASSDSDENARLTADVVISTNEDASVKINAQMVALSATGGGKIFVRKGTYNAATSIVLQNYTNLEGEGDSTAIDVSGLSAGINTNLASNCTLCNFKIIGDNTAGANIDGSNADVRYINILSLCTGVTRQNYFYCHNMHKCRAANGARGFTGCEYLTECECECSTVWGASSGFYQAKYLVCCIAKNYFYGYNGCTDIASCYAESCQIGYISIYHMSTCKAFACGQYGYQNCYGISNSWGWSCQTISASFAFTATFRNCHGIIGNRAGQASIYYVSCTPEWGSSANAAADTAAGGWNVTA